MYIKKKKKRLRRNHHSTCHFQALSYKADLITEKNKEWAYLFYVKVAGNIEYVHTRTQPSGRETNPSGAPAPPLMKPHSVHHVPGAIPRTSLLLTILIFLKILWDEFHSFESTVTA